jgi:WD40 repeat protein
VSPLPAPRVFISYARQEGGACARHIRQRLEQAGIAVWQDIDGIPGGDDWKRAIEAAIRHPDLRYLVLILTGHALEREIIQWECRLAKREGKCIKPIRGDPDLKIDRLPQWLRDRGIVDPREPKSLDRLVKDLDGDCQAPRVIKMAPPLQPTYVTRQQPLAKLKALLMDQETGAPRPIVATLVGAPGFGKTTLAQAFCRDEEVNEIFHQGVLWVHLGPDPGDPTSQVLNLIELLDGRRPGFTDLNAARSCLYDRLEHLVTLMVIDDVWSLVDAEPFLARGKRSACVITSRNRDCVIDDKAVIEVEGMEQSESLQLLSAGVPALPEAGVRAVASRLGHWPQLLALANGWLRACDRAQQPADNALRDLVRAYDQQGISGLGTQRSQAIQLALRMSLDQLHPDEADRFRELTVFPPGLDTPLFLVKRLWLQTGRMTDVACDALCLRLFESCLVHSLDLGQGYLRIHGVIIEALDLGSGKDRAPLHEALLESYSLANWWDLPEDESYLWRHLAWHLIQAGRQGELQSLLLDFRWLDAKLRMSGLGALLEDLDGLPDHPELRLLARALRLSARYLSRDPGQLAAQLRGRLCIAHHPELQPLLESLSCCVPAPRLLHRFPGLTAPGGVLVCAFTRSDSPISAVAVSPDRGQALSGSPDAKVRLWDLVVGNVLAILGDQSDDDVTQAGHRGSVTAVAFAVDGEDTWALSGSSDRAAILWDLDSYAPWKILGDADNNQVSTGHQAPVTALVNLDGARRVLTGADDGSFILWDLDGGNPRVQVSAKADRIAPLFIVANGGKALASGLGGQLMTWNLGELKLLRRLAEKDNALGVFVLLTTPPMAVIATADGSLATSDLEAGVSIALEGINQSDATALALFADRRHAVSGHQDGSLVLWDLEGPRVSRQIRHRPDPIHALAVVNEGFQVLAASGTGRLDRLDLGAEASPEPPAQHKGRVRCVTLLAGESIALTGATDGTLRFWNMATGACLRRLSTGTAPLLAASAQADGGAVWVSTADGLLFRVVDSESEPLEISEGISGQVTAMAVSSTGEWMLLGTKDGQVSLWETSAMEAPVGVGRHHGLVNCISLREDKEALTGCSDGSLVVWDLVEGELLMDFPGYGDSNEDGANEITACAFGPGEGEIIVGYANGDVRVRDLDTTETLQFIPGSRARGRVTGLVTLRGTDLALIAAEDAETPLDYGSLGLWNLGSGKCLATLMFEDPPSSLVVTNDGRFAVVGDAEGKVHFIAVSVLGVAQPILRDFG